MGVMNRDGILHISLLEGQARAIAIAQDRQFF